jgi:hypothetical protein
MLSFQDGDRYQGEFKANLFHGEGVYYCRSGDRYAGTFDQGTRSDFSKAMFDNLGKRGEKGPGEGVLTYPEGDVYIGQFEDGVPHGEGTMRFVDGEVVKITMNRHAWFGTCVYGNGDEYTGQFSGNMPHGEGVLVFKGGSRYQGNFDQGYFVHGRDRPPVKEHGTYKRGKLQGFGTRQVHDQKYEGEFKQGLYHGKGLLQVTTTGFRYEGEFKSGRFNGYGRMEYGMHPDVCDKSIQAYGVTAMLPTCRLQPEGATYEGTVLRMYVCIHVSIDNISGVRYVAG